MFKILSIIFKKKKYAFIVFITTLIMGLLSYYLTVATVSGKSIVIFTAMSGLGFTILSLFFSLVIALLFGAYIALLFFRRDIIKVKAKGDKLISSAGGLTGLVAAGCPSCGTPLLGLVGLPLGLFSLPFKGLELKVLSIIFLFLSIYLISKNIKKNLICEQINK